MTVKNILKTSLALIITLNWSSCLVDEHKNIVPQCEIQANGLSRAINELVPENILAEMRALNMPINTGGSPPIIDNSTFKGSPFILLSSTIPNDKIGGQFDDMIVSFNQQDNNKLSLIVDYENGFAKGKGLGSFIAGNGNDFSIFAKIDVESTQQVAGIKAKSVYVFSGTLTPTGIKNFHAALFMVDDAGDPNNIWIENGQGRVVYDKDGFSEKL